MSNTPENRQWLNNPQQIVLGANPKTVKMKAGRRVGKSTRVGAGRTAGPALKLVGSSGWVAGTSYSKLMDDLIPNLVTGWAELGLIEDEDYVIGKTPPKNFKRPLQPPIKFDHYISFSWGSGCHIISFDHTVTSNGKVTDWGLLDENKQINPERFNSDLMNTMSGHGSMWYDKARNIRWRDLPEHLMLTFLSDAYIGPRDYDWGTAYQQTATPHNELLKILYLVEELQKNYDPYLEREIWERQRKARAYIEASTEEMLPVLGIDWFKDKFKNTSPLEFRTSILNEEVKEIEGGFYKFLDEAVHTYEARDNNRIDSIGISDYLRHKQRNCLLDKDWRKELPLRVGVDYGSTHCWFEVAQLYANSHWFLNNFWTNNEQVTEGVDKVCDYYKYQERKEVLLYDDPGGHKRNTDQQRDLDKVIKRFKERGWKVTHMTPGNYYIPHQVKYRIWEKGLDERNNVRDGRFTKARWNLNNAYESYYSCSKAGIKIGRKDEFTKDKDSEKNKSLEQWKATHLSDTCDMIYCTDNLHLVKDGTKWATW